MLRSHSAKELREQYLIEQFWPVGHQADNLRALLIGYMMQISIAGDKNGRIKREIEMIWKKLNGTFDPEKDFPKPLTKQQAKAAFGLNL